MYLLVKLLNIIEYYFKCVEISINQLVAAYETFHLYKYAMTLVFLLRVSQDIEKVCIVIGKLTFKGDR